MVLNGSRGEYNNIKERIKTYATDEGLGNMKNVLTSNISMAFESTKTSLATEKQKKIDVKKRKNEVEKRQITDKITTLKQEKSVLESGNTATGQRGLFQINKEIEKSKLKKRSLEQSFVVKKFWRIGTSLVLACLVIFVCYLSVFFASAVYKVFFEGNVIRASLEAGITPGIPQLVDANAISKIYRQQGVIFGLVATLFFLLPVLLSNLKMLRPDSNFSNGLAFLIGLLIFDVVVSGMVAMNTHKIESLLVGQEPTLPIWGVVKQGEFWLIFVFGTLPLLLTHFLIDYLT